MSEIELIIKETKGGYMIFHGSNYLSAHWVGFKNPALVIKPIDQKYIAVLGAEFVFTSIEDAKFIGSQFLKDSGVLKIKTIKL